MPWQRTEPMDERLSFIASWLEDEVSMSELCRRYGVSRKTGYKWVDRYQAAGLAGLQERSRAPLRHAQQIAPAMIAAALAARRLRPSWGPRKIRAWLSAQDALLAVPAASTLGRLFDEAGLTMPRRRRDRVPPRTAPFAGCDGPNSVWTADFKGWFRTGDGARCEPFTLLDGWSRYLLRCQAVHRADTATVRGILEAAFREYGLPAVFRSDNGAPFAGRGAGGLSRLFGVADQAFGAAGADRSGLAGAEWPARADASDAWARNREPAGGQPACAGAPVCRISPLLQ